MTEQYYQKLDEKLYSATLSNGLRVMIVPKPGFSRKSAYFVTDFGAIHTKFRLEDREHTMPAGVAHYLEHKLFDLPGRDVSAQFAAYGAAVNAFTSYDLTAYYFSCTENFDPCLRLLLEFVSTPYFTAESVEKERGIIDQEIAMNMDDPNTRVFENLMEAMYGVHPIRVPILGTEASIRQITPEVLYTCHRAFYTPENMLLCVMGDVDPEAVCAAAEEILGAERKNAAVKAPLPQEDLLCPEKRRCDRMDIPMPSFYLGFKCLPVPQGEEGIRQEVIGDLAAEVLFGEASELYLKLYEEGLIDSSFGGGFEVLDGCSILTCGGDSDDAEKVRGAIIAQARAIAKAGVAESDFLRLKRSAMGRRIRDLDSFSSTCFRLCAYACDGFDYFNFPQIYKTVTVDQIQTFLDQFVTEENCAISIIHPIKEDNL
jgi:predicted Zn-dependent peptidase